jgi:molybdopterin synthase sulfur carrier subunit
MNFAPHFRHFPISAFPNFRFPISMPSIPVTIPGLLRHAIGGDMATTIEADTLSELIAKLKQKYPLLVPLLWDETGELRKHVLIFYNDTATRWLPLTDQPLKDGDTVAVMQAISGG